VFEVFVKPAVDKPAYYEFQVNTKNTQADCFIPRRGNVGRFNKLHDRHRVGREAPWHARRLDR